ncbi:60S ribosomal protein L12 [Camelus dromedarius]|uniref:60S ribosomal protein L12 n=1 Tax=Camelus dromedarius TaxID=9838 RepID=A0A5N4EIQ2_CAMDR|nr:60S ribosomal protein L12 [Camelus dromedarius]
MSALASKISHLSIYPKKIDDDIIKATARELSGAIKEILRTVQFVDCNLDGHYPHNITDGIHHGVAECPDN